MTHLERDTFVKFIFFKGFKLNCVSCSFGLISRLKMNTHQGTTFYNSTHNVFLRVQMLARVYNYQPVEI